MSARIHKFQPAQTTATTQIARVTVVSGGLAQRVWLEESEVLVAAQLDHVARVMAGDQVLVSSTSAGLIVTGRIRKAEEPLPPRFELVDGVFTMSCSEDLCLRTADASIRICADGQVFIDGQQILNRAKGPLKLQGSIIELN